MPPKPGADGKAEPEALLEGAGSGSGWPRDRSLVWRHRLAVGTSLATLALILVGGLVTSTGSGLAVPDWPLSYGMLMPPMVGGVFYEHGHRMAATCVGLLTLCLVIWTAKADGRTGVRRLAWACLAAVVLQGLLGGLTVIYLLPTPVSVAHACLAQTFLCLAVALAYATSNEWVSGASPTHVDVGFRRAAVTLTAVVYAQLILGALMRHMGAGLAIPDFPLSFGRLVPPMSDPAVVVHFAHRIGAVVVLAATLFLLAEARRQRDRRLLRGAVAFLALVLLQAVLGALTVLSGRAVFPATIHVTLGAASLGGAWLLTLRAFRVLRPSQGGAVVKAQIGEPAVS